MMEFLPIQTGKGFVSSLRKQASRNNKEVTAQEPGRPLVRE